MHRVMTHGFDKQKVVNAILHGYGVIQGSTFMQIVISRAAFVINIRVGVAFAFPFVMALNTSVGLFFEFIQVQDEKGHG